MEDRCISHCNLIPQSTTAIQCRLATTTCQASFLYTHFIHYPHKKNSKWPRKCSKRRNEKIATRSLAFWLIFVDLSKKFVDKKTALKWLQFFSLGFEMTNLKPPVWAGGETEALNRLDRHLERKAWVASFGKPKMNTQSLLPSQTGLSPYLKFGCLSTRLFYHALRDLYKKVEYSLVANLWIVRT